MQVHLNGENILLPHSQMLAVFLEKRSIGLQAAGIAVAVNGRIVFRSDWTSTNN